MKDEIKKAIVVFFVAGILALIMVTQVKAQESDPMKECTKNAILKAYGASAVYGGGVMAIGAVIGVAVAPVSLAAGTVIVGVNTLTGAAVGLGSSAVTRVMDEINFNKSPIVLACKDKIQGQVSDLIPDFIKKAIPKI